MQELDDPQQQVTDPDAITVFLRRWNPAQMTLGVFQEATINREFSACLGAMDIKSISSVFGLFAATDEIKSLIAELSGIPEDNVEYAKVC